jgi:hypothetical protein
MFAYISAVLFLKVAPKVENKKINLGKLLKSCHSLNMRNFFTCSNIWILKDTEDRTWIRIRNPGPEPQIAYDITVGFSSGVGGGRGYGAAAIS